MFESEHDWGWPGINEAVVYTDSLSIFTPSLAGLEGGGGGDSGGKSALRDRGTATLY